MVIIVRNISKPIPLTVKKATCGIRIQEYELSYMGTGFFMKVNDSSKYLITANHVVKSAIEKNEEIEILIWNKKIFRLTLNERFIKNLGVQDIAAIEIKDSDLIYKDLEFLDYDHNYINYGYSIYQDTEVFSIQYGFGNEITSSSGNIKKVESYVFYHTIRTEGGSSGSPIILLNTSRVIGIHTSYDEGEELNVGTFIGEIIKELEISNQMNLHTQKVDNNKLLSTKNNAKINTNNIKKISKNIDNNIFYNSNNNIDEKSNNTNKSINPIQLEIDLTNNNKDNNDIIIFYIKSSDQMLNCKICCRSSDRFNTIMNVILEKEPLFEEKVGFFLCNGNKVNEYKTLKDNGIKNGNVVLLNLSD